MTKQIELFNPLEFIDLTHGMTPRSTRRKQPKHRKTIAPLPKTAIALQTSQTINTI